MVMGLFKKFLHSEDGFVAVEYAALIGAMAIVSTMAAGMLEGLIDRMVDNLDLRRSSLPITK